MGDWTPWSECDAPCGRGTIKRTKSPVGPQYSPGCRSFTETRPCCQQSCQGTCSSVDLCNFVVCDLNFFNNFPIKSRDYIATNNTSLSQTTVRMCCWGSGPSGASVKEHANTAPNGGSEEISSPKSSCSASFTISSWRYHVKRKDVKVSLILRRF